MDELQRMMIERACERLVIAYTHSIDLHNREGLGDLFTEHAVVEMNGQAVNGRAAIVNGSGGPAPLMRHVCTNIAIDVASDHEATGTTYLTAYVQAPDDASLGLPFVVGIYRDVYRKTDEGWQIAKRSFTPTLRRDATKS